MKVQKYFFSYMGEPHGENSRSKLLFLLVWKVVVEVQRSSIKFGVGKDFFFSFSLVPNVFPPCSL